MDEKTIACKMALLNLKIMKIELPTVVIDSS